MTYLEKTTDRIAVINYGVIGIEFELEKAKKRRYLAKDKYKKASRIMLAPKRRFQLEEVINVANQEVAAWERRLEMAQRMIKGVE